MAACNDEVAAVKLLVELGAAKEAKSVDGMTPLHAAAANGQVEAVKLLVVLGAYKEAKCDGGATPLHMAASNGKVAVIRALVELALTSALGRMMARHLSRLASASTSMRRHTC